MKIAIYARKSRLTDTGDSIQMQLDACEHYISHTPNLSNYETVCYQDEGYSGGNTQRPAFQRMMNDCINGHISYVLCYKIDRFSRSLADFSTTYRILEQNHIHFISTTDNFDTTTPIGKAMLNIAMVFAELERDTTTQRIKDNLIHLSHAGKWLGGTVPLGYKSISINYTSNNHEKSYKQLEIDSNYSSLVKLIFEKYLEYGSLSALKAYLSQHQLTTRNHKYFQLNSLHAILSNPTYVGCDIQIYHYFEQLGCNLTFPLESCDARYGIMPFNRTNNSYKSSQATPTASKQKPPNEWIIARGTHAPIIAPSMWLQTQQQLAHNASKNYYTKKGSTSKVALLTDLIFCKKCGAPMKVTNQSILADGTLSYIYRCANKLKSKGLLCNVPNIRGHYLDHFILTSLEQQIVSKQNFIKQLLLQKEHFLTDLSSPIDLEKHYRDSITRDDKSLYNIGLLMATLDITNDTDQQTFKLLQLKVNELNNQKSKNEKLLSELYLKKPVSCPHSNDIDHIIHYITNFSMLLNNASLTEKRQLLQSLSLRIEWDGEVLYLSFYPSLTNHNLP